MIHITDVRYKCSICVDYHLCETCIRENESTGFRVHSASHAFLRIPWNRPTEPVRTEPVCEVRAPRRNKSGQTSYDLAQYNVDHDTLKRMLRREEELRISDETQRALLVGGEDSYAPVIAAVQAKVSREFGLSVELGTMLLQCADRFARSEAELAEITSLSLYRRNNRCVDGNVQVGDVAPRLSHPLHLVPRDRTQPDQDALTPVHLFDLPSRTAIGSGIGTGTDLPRPTILLAGSWS